MEIEALVQELEALTLARSGDPRALKKRVEEAISMAESASAPDDILCRLDDLLIKLTEASREKVCTNEKCPHYGKRCKMM